MHSKNDPPLLGQEPESPLVRVRFERAAAIRQNAEAAAEARRNLAGARQALKDAERALKDSLATRAALQTVCSRIWQQRTGFSDASTRDVSEPEKAEPEKVLAGRLHELSGQRKRT
jgi:uncharacterized membrane protein YqiK